MSVPTITDKKQEVFNPSQNSGDHETLLAESALGETGEKGASGPGRKGGRSLVGIMHSAFR
ncbi:hypothetical protein PAAG_03099 [Paracoccidioides lutzii Pb01]|uniref:Uncharacterized protein n=1 Tax=Paracoccidioides lutzii (strain ATCC MYA-826 / Pb01) TaxID=502779 RepID=C1GYE5_PARBA|nr:hypothetical protein PAAG_03099 [Paracoccidioides lutzii Pb01]EEH41536.2 hypothetical protein PAAG_03099 [Paracoccidioides lutzii Pb01]